MEQTRAQRDRLAARLQQHYFDSRSVAHVYEMTLEDGVWTLFREGPY
jgi:hypothetical protein